MNSRDEPDFVNYFDDDDAPLASSPTPPPPMLPPAHRRRHLLLAVAGIVLIAVVVAILAQGVDSPNRGDTSAAPSNQPAPASAAPPISLPSSAMVRDLLGQSTSGSDWLPLLAEVDVKGRAPSTGYFRDEYGAPWSDIDRNGCDTRNDVLQRDLANVAFQLDTADCVVLTGVLDDPYTGEALAFTRGPDTSREIQVDHVVALADSWVKGAQYWDADTRAAFANDPLNLLAVAGWANEQKGAGDAATWLPPNQAVWCTYAARIVAVKATYDVWMTSAEQRRIEEILDDCDAISPLVP